MRWASTHPWRWALVLGMVVTGFSALLNFWINGSWSFWVFSAGFFTFIGAGLYRSRGWDKRRADWW